MKRFARVVVVCLAAILGFGASMAQAQVNPPPADSKMYVEVNFGPTLGHNSSGFAGGEFGFGLTSSLDVFVEGSHMNNVGTTDLDNNATTIANFLKGTASTAYVVNHAAFGVRYHMEATPMIHPYVLVGAGLASVKTEVAFTVNGQPVDPAASGVQLGGDLTGTHNKAIIVVGFGAHVPFAKRFFGDIGYRYGHILANTSDVENDTSIPTQRVVFGVGVRF